jgi:hypothetical protein
MSIFSRIVAAVKAVVKYIVSIVTKPKAKVVGISVKAGTPVPKPKGVDPMKVELKTGPAPVQAAPNAPAPKIVGDPNFVIFDNQNDTFSVQGVDAGGNAIDISGVATITVVSSDPTIGTVATPTGMTFAFSAVAPGATTVTVTATWTDNSVGPFTFDVPVTVSGTAAVGLKVTPGTPVAR